MSDDKSAAAAFLKELAELHTWEEKCVQEAKNRGYDDPDMIEEHVQDREGDQSDDWLMDRNSQLEGLITRARELLEPEVVAPETQDDGPSI